MEEALRDRLVRLVGIHVEGTGSGRALGEAIPDVALRDLGPEAVFLACYKKAHHGELPAELLAVFHELLDGIGQREGKAT